MMNITPRHKDDSTHEINKCGTPHLQNELYMIISIDAEKALSKIQQSSIIKIINELDIEETYFNIIKVIYDKPPSNTVINGKRLNILPLRSGTR